MEKPARRSRGAASYNGQALEMAIQMFGSHGFHIYNGMPEFRRAEIVPDRYVICHYAHETLWGTSGYKEGFISVGSANEDMFFPSSDGSLEIILEAKYQQKSGSVDEKIPYVYEAFKASVIPNWIVVFSGKVWTNTKRGKAAILWLRKRWEDEQDSMSGRRLYICGDIKELANLVKAAWGK